ncbi:glycoprotein endo-alpha-1,2-mannosidase-like isoform X1 [Narcine bancroftii]|uniref:glycoprotein endo-alpha-1,2-mannosidase-like isoform X1 n=1 Tax=Narcine bancroftii TaxID=1343680 RepID=UPI003831676C
MARFRRKMWITLLLFLLFVFGVMMGLKTLRPEGVGFIDSVGLELLPQLRYRAADSNQRANIPKTEKSAESGILSHNSKTEEQHGKTQSSSSDGKLDNFPAVNYDLHAFYYSWYGNQKFDGKYIHWNHPLVPHWDPKIANSYPKGRHNPPEDIGSNFYPELGAYSSRDPAVLNAHMKQFQAAAVVRPGRCQGKPRPHPSARNPSGTAFLGAADGVGTPEGRWGLPAGRWGHRLPCAFPPDQRRVPGVHVEREAGRAGVLALSWYPPGMSDENGEPTEDLVLIILEAAHKYQIKVTFHIEPYEGRENGLYSNLKYIIDKYGSHPAFYRHKTNTGRTLPMFYIYDSYLTSPESWANLFSVSGSSSVRNTQYDALFIALIVEEKHKNEILQAGFDGMYTYFATNGFSHGSSHQNWQAIKDFCDSNNLMFIPSVGPGYIDTSIRAWNKHNTRNRVNGKYYETALSTALLVRPDIITVTSFNEWHEGTQIEKAVPKKSSQLVYLDYLPHNPDIYLEITRKWAEKFRKEKEQWLM